jgi:hypothetical protein
MEAARMSVTIQPVHPRKTFRELGTAPECNFANGNARPLLATVGLDPGPYLTGEIGPDEVEAALRECDRALAHDADALVRRAPLLRAEARPSERWVEQASTDASALRRLRDLRDLLAWALRHGCGIGWS